MEKPDSSITEPFLLDIRTNTIHYVRGLQPECHAKEIPQGMIRRLTTDRLLGLADYRLCPWCNRG